MGTALVFLGAGPASTLRAASASSDDPAWHSLFDGRTLNGWRANESPDSFSVVDGQIVVRGNRSHLFYAGDVGGADFRNFVFEAEVMTRPSANSGVFFHTQFQPEGWPAHGYEVQVNTSHGDTIKTGSLYGVVKVNPAPSIDGQWFVLRIEVRDRMVKTSVDGNVVVNFIEPRGVEGERRLSHGTFALQAHDPGSEVHFRKLRVQLLPDQLTSSRADWVATRTGEWYDRMDYGPFLTTVVTLDREDSISKGISVELDPERTATMSFDTDLLRMAAGWTGPLALTGTPFDGRHGTQPRPSSSPWFRVRGPGVAQSSSFADTRPVASGPLPRARGHYRGLYRHGDDVVFEYSAGTRVLRERPAFGNVAGLNAFQRHFEVESGNQAVRLSMADERGRTLTRLASGRVVMSGSEHTAESLDDRRGTVVVLDRSEDGFAALSMGPPSADDDLEASRNPRAKVWGVAAIARPHPRAGANTDGDLVRVHDGKVPENSDDTRRNSWFDGAASRVEVDLGSAQSLARVNTYSWHRSNRSPQRYVLWGSASEEADAGSEDLSAAGWTRIAEVDTSVLGEGGQHGSSISNRAVGLGTFQRLIFDMRPLSNDEGTFLSEIDVFVAGRELSDLRPPRAVGEQRSLAVALCAAPPGVTLEIDGERVVLNIPASSSPLLFCVALTREMERADPGQWAADLREAEDLTGLLSGGPSAWPQELVVEGSLAEGDDAYLVDDVPIPFENSWESSMRIGAFDFFSEGDRAALSTWNGDVWILSGLNGDWKSLRWRRFAAGLFEPLGLKIVDDIVYVNGRDQITRLHDLDGDGEADFYENFNNDIQTTPNFHEFTFDLQTDAAGNFYFSKAGPVRPGGRGFDPIVPHHGTVLKLSADGSELEVYSTGMRAPNGIGVGPNGQVTASDNEGTWVPHCKLHWLHPGSFQGVIDTAHRAERPDSYNPPLCWFPMEVDNSGGCQVWVTSDQWGLPKGDLLHLSYGQSTVYHVMFEERGEIAQGGVVKIPVQLGSSAMRARFHPADGQLYVSGLRGWQTNASRLSAFQRLRYNGKPLLEPCALHVHEDGIELRFAVALSKELAEDVESYAVEQWNYVWGPQYGSPEVSALHPDPEILAKALETEMHDYRVHDTLHVQSAKLSADGKSVFLKIGELGPVMQMKITADLETAAGKPFLFDLYNTIHWLSGPGS